MPNRINNIIFQSHLFLILDLRLLKNLAHQFCPLEFMYTYSVHSCTQITYNNCLKNS